MVGVDHVLVVQVDRRRLVGDVERMVERQVPDGEALELRVAGDAALAVLVVDLRQARRELARPGARRRHDHDRLLRRHVLVLAVSLVRHDRVDVRRIPRRLGVAVDADAAPLELGAEELDGRLVLEARDDDAAHGQPEGPEVVDELQRVVRVGDAEVGAHLLALDVAGEQAEDDLRVVFQRLEEAELHVRVVAGQAARRVEVVHQLAAELEVEASVLAGAAPDLLRLLLQVLLVVKALFHLCSSSRMAWILPLHRPQPPPAFVKFVTSSTVVSWFSAMTRRTSFSETL